VVSRVLSSVRDPWDPYVFGPHGSGSVSGEQAAEQCKGSVGSVGYVLGPPGSASGSVSHKYGSGSGSCHHLAKIVSKILISTVL
jgi:hypothetical protein